MLDRRHEKCFGLFKDVWLSLKGGAPMWNPKIGDKMSAVAFCSPMGTPWIRRKSIQPAVICALMLAAGPALADPPTYSLTEVRIPWGRIINGNALNNEGDIVGTVAVGPVSSEKIRGFLWSHKTRTALELGTLGGTSSSAFGINDCEEVVGAASLKGDAVFHAVLFHDGRITDLDPHGKGSIARGINNEGTAVGPVTVSGDFHPAIFQHGTVRDLTGTVGDATAISLSGEIVGDVHVRTAVNPDAFDQAFVIKGHTFTNINPVSGTPDSFATTDAFAINDFEDVAGIEGSSGSSAFAPFEYQDGQLLSEPALPDGYKSQGVLGINNAGELAGFSNLITNPFIFFATLTRGQTIYELNRLIDPTDPLAPFVSLAHANGINDSGWIVADGTDSRDKKAHVYLLKAKQPAFRWERINGGCPRTDHEDSRED
jgi:hypothetical protein